MLAGAPEAEPLARLGRLYACNGREAEGEELLRNVILRYPEYAPAYFYLGIHYERQGDMQEARALYERSLDLHPRAHAFVRLGHVYLSLKKDGDARRSFERARTLDPAESGAWFGLGGLDQWTRAEDATACFERALELDPNNGSAHRELGMMLYQRGETASAEEHIRTAVRIESIDAWAHDVSNYLANLEMGLLLKYQGKLSQARIYLERSLHAKPTDHRAREVLDSLPPNVSGGFSVPSVPEPGDT